MTTLLREPIWSVDGWSANVIDDNGVMWICDSDAGWYSPLDVRSADTDMPNGDGTLPGPDTYPARVITLAGAAKAPDEATADAAVDQFTAVLSRSALKTLSVTKRGVTRAITVKRSSGGNLSRTSPVSFDWQLVMIAPDPMKRLPAATVSTGLPQPGGGLHFPLHFPLDFGTLGSNGLLQLDNPGTADAWPIFTVLGPTDGTLLGNPFIVDATTGHTLAFTGSLGNGDQLVLSGNPHGRFVTLNGTPYRRFLTTAEWFPVPAGESIQVQFGGSATSTTPLLLASLAPALQ